MKKLLKDTLNKFGLQLQRYPSIDLARRIKIVKNFNINVLIDIGASVGQYALEMRKIGYKGKIISFEPRKSAYNILKEVAAKDKNWLTYNYAIGNENKNDFINISGTTDSSSILEMLPKHLEASPKSIYINKEAIEIKRLDTIYKSLIADRDRIMIKIDTQGFEKYVLDGTEKILSKIAIVQLEMSLVHLYEKEILWEQMIGYLDNKDFSLYSIENGMFNPHTGQLLQIDGLFVNKRFI